MSPRGPRLEGAPPECDGAAAGVRLCLRTSVNRPRGVFGKLWKYVVQYKKKMKPNLIKVISNTKNDMK